MPRVYLRPVQTAQILQSSLSLLEPRESELIDPGIHPHPETAFRKAAAIVIGARGSALPHLLFCQPGIKVLELVLSDHAHPFLCTIAVNNDPIYDCLIGHSDSVKIHPANQPRNRPGDFVVDINATVRTPDHLLN